MDKMRVALAVVLSIAFIVVYSIFFAPKPLPPAPARPLPPGQVQQGTPAPGQAPAAGPAEAPAVAAGARPGAGVRKPVGAYAEGPDVVLSSSRVDLAFATRGGALRTAEVWACEYHAKGDRTVTGDPGAATCWIEGLPGALALDLSGSDMPDTAASNWRLTRSEDGVIADLPAAGLAFTRQVRFTDDYGGTVEYQIRNESAPAGSEILFDIVGPVLPVQTLPDDSVLLAQAGEGGEVEILSAGEIRQHLAENASFERNSPAGTWAWIASRSDFYLGALIPEGDLPADTKVGFRAAARPKGTDLSADVAAPTFRIKVSVPPAGESKVFRFRFYAGPNKHALFTAEGSPYSSLAGATVSRKFLGLSFRPLGMLLGWLLRLIADTGIGYGLAVIALTILVRGLLFPLSRQSQISMRLHAQKMARLKPKMDAVKAKYKDPKKQQEATMKLMREEKVSILPGGCLLAFLQMPIWISLYGVLQTTFEMRHASFLWAHDLTQADHLFHIGAGLFLIPEWLNLLPLIMMVVWYISAAMQPLPPDPQQAQQAKMMRWMPVLFGFMLYTTASGLTLYMTMSAVWSIGETWLIRKVWLAKLENALK